MKCPLLAIAWGHVASEEAINYPDCLKEECAWWDDDSGACAIWAIMSGLDALGKLFREIEQKMPHERSYVK